jgi:hypothetical protein
VSYAAAWWRFWPTANVGLATGHPLPDGGFLSVLDVDPRHDGDASLDAHEAEHGPLPRTFTVRTGGGGWHHYFHTAEPLRSCQLLPGVELKARGALVVAPPSLHPSGWRYEVEMDAPVAELPAALRALVPNVPTFDPAAWEGDGLPAGVLDMLEAIPASVGYDEWLRVGMALHHADPDAGFDLWNEWSATCPQKYRPREIRQKWKSFARAQGRSPVTLATLRRIASEHGWEDPAVAQGAAIAAQLIASARREATV